MITRDDLESYLIRMDLDLQEVEESMWVLKSGDDGIAPVVVNYAPPVVLLRIKVMDLPRPADDTRLATFYRRMLELNATDIVHGSYGIEGEEVVLSDALELETLDFAELQSSYESLSMAAATQVPELASIIEQGAAAPAEQG
ncbi:MAG TPA: hypothetical protein VK929_00350 [Longimicrobiales bacterium]|nr:hypothetical protein [Longimicrobiales bacterium]